MKISVVIPCYASESTLEHVVTETITILEQRPEADFEIVLVNDGSPDNTFDTIRNLAKDRRVKGMNLSRNFGQAGASMAGFTHSSGDIVVYADDDGQSPVEHLWEIIDAVSHGADVAYASFSKRPSSLIRSVGTRINNLTATLLTGKPRQVQLTNFWACQRYVIEQITKSTTPFPSVGGLLAKSTQNWTPVPVQPRARLNGKSKYTLRKLVSLWLNGATGFSVLPLRLGAILGLVIGSIGIVFSIVTVLRWFLDPVTPPGYTSVFAGMLVLSGINIALVGLVGEYIARAYLTLNRVPQFVVKSRVNF